MKLRIPDAIASRFSVDSAHAAKIKLLEEDVKKANKTLMKRALNQSNPEPTPAAAAAGGNDGGGQGGSPPPARTTCQPAFTDTDKPVDVSRTLELASIPSADFQSTHSWRGCIYK